MKIAQIQFDPKLGSCAQNIKTIQEYLDKIEGADLIVLPELANTGYNFNSKEHAFSISKEPDCLRYIDFLRLNANKKSTHIVSGYLENDGDSLYNSSVLVSPDGETGNYRKIHLFMNEKNIFEYGNSGLPTFMVGKYKIGMLICFDYLFPEVWRAMSLQDVDIIVHPSNLLTQNAFIVVPAQALMNGYFIITSNRTGIDGELKFCGKSFVCDPRGNVISEMGENEEGILITNIDPEESRNKMVTPRNHILNDRRPENYNKFFAQ